MGQKFSERFIGVDEALPEVYDTVVTNIGVAQYDGSTWLSVSDRHGDVRVITGVTEWKYPNWGDSEE